MNSLNKLLVGLILVGLLAVALFTFGKQGILVETITEVQEPQMVVENTNKITVAEITNEKELPLDNSKSEVVLNTFISAPDNDLEFDHLLNAREFDGAVVFSGNEPAGLTLHVKAPVSLPSAELPKSISGHKTSTRNDTKSPGIRNYPKMALIASSFKKIRDNKYMLYGLFTLHGVTRRIQVPIILGVTEDLVRVQGELSFLQSDYSTASSNTAAHTIQNQDKVVLIFNLSASAK